jgi:2-oxoglutarate dehydrogenase E1 component
MGGWGFMRPHLRSILGKDPRYVGRDESPSPAVGSFRLYREEQEKIINDAFKF